MTVNEALKIVDNKPSLRSSTSQFVASGCKTERVGASNASITGSARLVASSIDFSPASVRKGPHRCQTAKDISLHHVRHGQHYWGDSNRCASQGERFLRYNAGNIYRESRTRLERRYKCPIPGSLNKVSRRLWGPAADCQCNTVITASNLKTRLRDSSGSAWSGVRNCITPPASA